MKNTFHAKGIPSSLPVSLFHERRRVETSWAGLSLMKALLSHPCRKVAAQELIGSLNLDCEVGKGFYSELWVVSSQVLKNRDAPT